MVNLFSARVPWTFSGGNKSFQYMLLGQLESFSLSKKFLTLLVFTQRLILVNSWTYMLQKWFYMCIYLHIWIYIVFTLLCSDCVFHLWNDIISSNNSFYLYTTFYGPGNSLSSLGILTWCNSHTNPLSAITVQISGWWGMWN